MTAGWRASGNTSKSMLAELKTRIVENCPKLAALLRWISRQRWRFGSTEDKFVRIYRKNLWGDSSSCSGPGSTLEATVRIREEIPALLRRIEARTMLDIPCGDFHWMSQIDLPIEQYFGADLVGELVARNQRQYGSGKITFLRLDLLTETLLKVDVLLVRECLVHFSNRDIHRALRNIKRSRSTYLLTTSHLRTDVNRDIHTGDWRPVNLERAPFFLPPPRMTIVEDEHMDKSMGLWKVADIPD